MSIWQVIHRDFWLILLVGCLNTPFLTIIVSFFSEFAYVFRWAASFLYTVPAQLYVMWIACMWIVFMLYSYSYSFIQYSRASPKWI
jgi:hypothetical protein